MKPAENDDKRNEDLKSAFRLFMDNVLPKGAKKAVRYSVPVMRIDPAPEEEMALYVAPISDGSMEPAFHDGDNLFIHASVDIEIGQIGAFLMDASSGSRSAAPVRDPIPTRP